MVHAAIEVLFILDLYPELLHGRHVPFTHAAATGTFPPGSAMKCGAISAQC